MAIDLGSVELYLGPADLGAPDDLEATVLAFIDAAHDSLDIAVQELESEPLVRALVSARQRGVKIRIIVEGMYLREGKVSADPFLPGGENEENRRLLAVLQRASIEVYVDLNPATFHQKYVIRDAGSSSRRAVLTGSTNFTPTGLHRNLNNVVILKSKRAVDAYQAEFDESLSGTFGRLSLRDDAGPAEFTLAKIRVKILFAPDHAPELEIMKQMLKARDRIDFAMFTFAHSSGIDDTLFALQKAGIFVRGVLDGRQGAQPWAPTSELVRAGCEIYTASGHGLGKLHHKLMIIDEQTVIVGSFNFTGPANSLNDENIVVMGDVFETDPEATTAQQQLGAFAMAEVDRIIQTFGHAVQPD